MNATCKALLGLWICVVALAGAAAAAPGDGEPAIALWSLPEVGEIPAEAPTVGIVAYHALGIERVEFLLGGKVVAQADAEALHEATGEMEWVGDLSQAGLEPGRRFALAARVTPRGKGTVTDVPERTFMVADPSARRQWFVDAKAGSDDEGDGSSERPVATVAKALTLARGGDQVLLHAGEHRIDLPRAHDFGRFVTIRPAEGAEVRITGVGNPRCGWLKFEDLFFDWRGNNSHTVFGSYSEPHLWFKRCRFEGEPGRFDNYTRALKFWGKVNHVTVEGCAFRYLDKAVAAPADSILRGNQIEDMTSDAFNFGSRTLISGNTIRGLDAPQMYALSGATEPFDLSGSAAEFTVFHRELHPDVYQPYAVDFAKALASPEKATAADVAAALNEAFKAGKPEKQFGLVASAEQGRVKIVCRRTNYTQYLYVEGPANAALGFAPEGKDRLLKGSGQHADVFQYWGGLKQSIIIRNNLAYDNSAQQWLAADSPTRDLAFVNNLLDVYYAGAWGVMLGGKYENVLIEFNTIWDASQTVILRREMFAHGENRNFIVRNNLIGGRTGMGALEEGKQFYTGYNLYSYTSRTPRLGPNSIDASEVDFEAAAARLFEHVRIRTSESGRQDSYAEGGDFSLREGSPAVDAGTPASGIPYDIRWRPRDARPDIGAFERQ